MDKPGSPRMDRTLRDELRKAVQRVRETLTSDLTEVLQQSYGLTRSGKYEDPSRIPELAADAQALATRELLEHVLQPPQGRRRAEHFDAMVRALAFTHLNRLVAFKLMEHPTRKLIKEAVGRGPKSRGFMFYLAKHPEDEQLTKTGQQEKAYQHFLDALCTELHTQIGVLFDPADLASRVQPRWLALEKVLKEINAESLEKVWEAEEALGWVYQYYTPKELKDKARKESQTPRNSYELAFRNQFYTPEYVVRFLGDNTLGRLWLAMLPTSTLRERCTYLALAPDERPAPRPKKDPREIRVLDPACGSGHFLLYAFELLEVIYLEAYDDAELGPPLREQYGERDEYELRVPALILEHSLYGIDIDRRATQIASLVLFLKARARSKDVPIEKGNVVCAEPMPGDRELFDAFKARKLGQPGGALPRILDGIWEHLQLADEVGSLLRAELEIGRLIESERRRWQQVWEGQGKHQHFPLFPGLGPEGQQQFSDVTSASFWDMAESSATRLLREYAEESSGAEEARRRLFARDGVEGLRFLDVLRQRFDVALMNPPFGGMTPRSKPVIEAAYPSSKADLFACFVERCAELVPSGYVGCISTEAGFFRKTLESWRKDVLLARTNTEILLHLGDNVLDTAKVRVAAYALSLPMDERSAPARFVRILGRERRLGRLRDAMASIRSGSVSSSVYDASQKEFEKLPYAAFGYWCSPAIRDAFVAQPSLDPNNAAVRQGLATAGDFRFLRLRWEAQPDYVGPSRTWVPFAKGGDYSPYHDDVHLIVKAENDFAELRAFEPAVIRNPDSYFKPGLTYPRRTNKRFAPRTLPAGCAFADKGPAILTSSDSTTWRLALLGALNSCTASYLISLGLGMSESKDISNSYEVGLVQKLPVPKTLPDDTALAASAKEALDARRQLDTVCDETAALYVSPFLTVPPASLEQLSAERIAWFKKQADRFAAAQADVECCVAEHYGFGMVEQAEITSHVGEPVTLDIPDPASVPVQVAADVVAWAVGVVFGRFDVRLGTGERAHPELPDPFAALPARSPGMLPADGPPAGYPLIIDADGILVDDAGNASDDIVQRVRDVLRVVWKEHAGAIETAACRLLGCRDLRAYFGKGGKAGFWETHVGRYSKSKRRAPIYWLLQSPRKTYSVWLYYPALERDSLYKLLGTRYLEGRLQRTRNAIEELRPGGKKKDGLTKKDERRLENLDAELTDLEEFDARIRAVVGLMDDRGETAGYVPDMDDGVVLNAAPLHALIPWPFKRKQDGKSCSELEIIWGQLSRGELDWARVARRYWPDRVHRAGQEDRSIALAHAQGPQQAVATNERHCQKCGSAAEPLVEVMLADRRELRCEDCRAGATRELSEAEGATS